MIDITQAQSLGEVARLQGQARGDATAFVFEGRTTSFAQFDTHANQVANGLLAAGLKKGTRVSYLGKNSDHYFEALFGAAKAGAVMAPVNWRLAAPEIVYIVNDCKAEVLFVGGEFIDLARKIAPELTTVRLIVAMEGGAPEWESYEGLARPPKRRPNPM